MYIAQAKAGRSLTAEERQRYGLAQGENEVKLPDVVVPVLAPWQRPRILHQDLKWHDRQIQECQTLAHGFGVAFHTMLAAKLQAEGVKVKGFVPY